MKSVSVKVQIWEAVGAGVGRDCGSTKENTPVHLFPIAFQHAHSLPACPRTLGVGPNAAFVILSH